MPAQPVAEREGSVIVLRPCRYARAAFIMPCKGSLAYIRNRAHRPDMK